MNGAVQRTGGEGNKKADRKRGMLPKIICHVVNERRSNSVLCWILLATTIPAAQLKPDKRASPSLKSPFVNRNGMRMKTNPARAMATTAHCILRRRSPSANQARRRTQKG